MILIGAVVITAWLALEINRLSEREKQRVQLQQQLQHMDRVVEQRHEETTKALREFRAREARGELSTRTDPPKGEPEKTKP
jgi:hypothetical protein